MLLRSLLTLILLFSGKVARADEFFEPFQSIRQLGMGGVYVFSDSDGSAFLQNPAYTCFSDGLNWTIFNVGTGIGDLQAAQELSDSGSSANPDSFSSLSPYYGKNIWVNMGGFSSFMTPCFGFAGTFTGLANFSLHNPAFPTMKTYYLTEYGLKIGMAYPITSMLSVGMDVKRMTRAGGPNELGPETLATLSGANSVQALISNFENTGVGYGIDVGVVARADKAPFNPTISVSWKDVGSTAYEKTNGLTAPERQKDNLVLGMTFDGSIPLLGIAGGMEYRHITDTGEQIGKKLHFGTELSLAFIDLRAGFNQGYTTYGMGVDLWILQFDAAWYKVEKGVYPGQTPDERAQIGIMMDLQFDPNFNLVDAGGKKRRLKQRR